MEKRLEVHLKLQVFERSDHSTVLIFLPTSKMDCDINFTHNDKDKIIFHLREIPGEATPSGQTSLSSSSKAHQKDNIESYCQARNNFADGAWNWWYNCPRPNLNWHQAGEQPKWHSKCTGLLEKSRLTPYQLTTEIDCKHRLSEVYYQSFDRVCAGTHLKQSMPPFRNSPGMDHHLQMYNRTALPWYLFILQDQKWTSNWTIYTEVPQASKSSRAWNV